MSYNRYIAVYKTTILDEPKVMIFGEVRVEVFSGSRTYKVPRQGSRILPSGEEALIAGGVDIITPEEGFYIEVAARTKEANPYIAEAFCETELNKAVAALSITLSSDMFDIQVYRGWVHERDRGIVHAWVKVVERLTIDEALLGDTMTSLKKRLVEGNDETSRFHRMAKYYAKSMLYDPGEEKFLLLWTMLEIFPMKGTASYRHIADYLSPILGMSPGDVADKLKIKIMHDERSKLVHNGKFEPTFTDLSDLMKKLESIVMTVLRGMAGLSYDGALDEYLK